MLQPDNNYYDSRSRPKSSRTYRSGNPDTEIKLGRGFAWRGVEKGLKYPIIIKKNKREAYRKYDMATMALFQRGGNPRNINSNNLIAVDKLRVDVDAKVSLLMIISLLITLGLGDNVDVVETFRGYHIIIYIQTFWVNGYHERIARANRVLDYLTRTFVHLGGDVTACSVLGFYRIPKKKNTVHRSRSTEKLSLEDIEREFKIHIPEEIPKRDKDRRQRFQQESRLQLYFTSRAKKDPEHHFVATHKEIAKETGISENTIDKFIQRVKEKGKLYAYPIGKGEKRETVFVWIFSQEYLKHSKSLNRNIKIYMSGGSSLARRFVERVRDIGLPNGRRNCDYYKAFLSFKLLNMGDFQACYEFFYDSFQKSRYNGGDFCESEYKNIIKQAYKSKYRCFFKTENLLKDSEYLGIGESVSGPDHSDCCDCLSCVPDDADFTFNFGENERVFFTGNDKLGLPALEIGVREKDLLDSHLEKIKKMNLERGFS